MNTICINSMKNAGYNMTLLHDATSRVMIGVPTVRQAVFLPVPAW